MAYKVVVVVESRTHNAFHNDFIVKNNIKVG